MVFFGVLLELEQLSQVEVAQTRPSDKWKRKKEIVRLVYVVDRVDNKGNEK